MPTLRTRHLVLSCALFAPLLPAQGSNVTVPAQLDGVEGGSATNIPFGSNLAYRYQCIYDADVLPWSGPRLITGISIRADNGSQVAPGTTQINGKGYLDISVAVTTTYASAATASSTFEDNYGEDLQWVVTHDHVQLPTQPVLTTVGPRPANIDLMFTTPWFFGLTPARGYQAPPANLLVEIWIHSQPSGAYRIDNLGGCVSTTTQFSDPGAACFSPNALPAAAAPTLTPGQSMIAGSPYSWTVENAPPSAPFLVSFNMTSQGGLFGNPAYALPYPLFDPANPSQPSPALVSLRWSAPDCYLAIDPRTALFGSCASNGIGVLTTQLPSGSQNVGVEYFAQALIFAPAANPLGLITSAGRSATICGPLAATRISAFYNNTGSPPPSPPSTGTVQYGQAMVFEVR